MTQSVFSAIRDKPHVHLPPSPNAPNLSSSCGQLKAGGKKSPRCSRQRYSTKTLTCRLTHGVCRPWLLVRRKPGRQNVQALLRRQVINTHIATSPGVGPNLRMSPWRACTIFWYMVSERSRRADRSLSGVNETGGGASAVGSVEYGLKKQMVVMMITNTLSVYRGWRCQIGRELAYIVVEG